MNQTLDNKIEPEMVEFYGPNFEHDCYMAAKYRMSRRTVMLGNIQVTEELEAFHTDETWKLHPVVFWYDATKTDGMYKYGRNALIFCLADGSFVSTRRNIIDLTYATSRYSSFEELTLCSLAETSEFGLRQGDKVGLNAYPKEYIQINRIQLVQL